MAADDETSGDADEGDMLPDERAVIIERLDELEDEESHLTVEEVADELGFDNE